MAIWGANFGIAFEITEQAVNRILEKVLFALSGQGLTQFSTRLTRFGQLNVGFDKLEVKDFRDVAPVDSISLDLELSLDFQIQFFNVINWQNTLMFAVDDAALILTRTQAGLPKGLMIQINQNNQVNLSLVNTGRLGARIFNSLIAPFLSLGIWLAFRLIRNVEIPLWPVVDALGAIGLRFAPGSPLLTAANNPPPNALILGSDFTFFGGPQGVPAQLDHFIPAHTNIGFVLHDKVLNSAVNTAFSKGWVPNRFRVGKLKIYINSIGVEFEKDSIKASGSLKAKRKKCWCRVKIGITFSLEVNPEILVPQPNQPRLDFAYRADASMHISTGGMVMIMGFIMFAPIFLALSLSLAHLTNLALDKFLPFRTTFTPGANQLNVQAASLNGSGLLPFNMDFDLDLYGNGTFDLSPFQQSTLPGNIPLSIGFTPESLALEQDELRLAVALD